MIFRHQIIQNAYHVADLDEAIERWHGLWGIGPFFVRRHIVLPQVTYRGKPAQLDISAAYVQAGPIQVELVTQHGDAPSAFRDAFAAHEEGLHHVAVIPDDHDRLVAEYEKKGFPVATSLRTASGRGAAYVDTRSMLGHMMEIYTISDSLTALYRDVAAASEKWDGRQLKIEVDGNK